MSEAWKQWEGQVVDAKFPLREYLGGSEYSAVFLTERGDPAKKAAIKFIQVDESDAELQLSRWKRAAQLSHPRVLRLFESGRCELGGFNLLYVLAECAEENLSQFLPQRPLTPAEARDVLEPVLEALTYLHGQGLVHGHIRPSNIFAIEDQLKLSSDGVSALPAPPKEPASIEPASPEDVLDEEIAAPEIQASETTQAAGASLRHASPYDPPEAADGIISPAGDVWSLGMTLVEALTQRLPVFPAAYPSSTRPPDPIVPETLPALFLDIVRHCLQRDAQRRWSVAQIVARLNPAAAAAAAAPTPKPLAPPPAPARLAPAPATRTQPYHVPASPSPVRQPQSPTPRDHYTRPRYEMAPPRLKQPPLLPPFLMPKLNYLALSGAAALALLLVLAGAKLFSHRAPERQSASAEALQSPAQKPPQAPGHGKNQAKSAQKAPANAARHAEQSTSQQGALSSAQNSTPAASGKQTTSTQPVAVNTEIKNKASATPATASLRSDAAAATPPASALAAESSAPAAKGEVLDQILPEPSQKAQATIRGKVRVRVKLHVDSSGNVTAADFDSPGPSKYFAELALKAARRWDFAPAKLDGHNVASDWLVRFEFTQTATKAFPAQATP
jgi:TonB family protein